MYVWLDDTRDPKRQAKHSWDQWIWIETYEETIALLETGKVTHISLDHDLGTVKTGYDVILWIEEKLHQNRFNLDSLKIEVHSANPVGRKKILDAIESMEKYWSEHKSNGSP